MQLVVDFQDYLKNLKTSTMNFIQRIFTGKKKLIEELEKTKIELTHCNCKLFEKQEHINSTNAYWKKKMYAVKAANKSKEA